MQNIDTDIQSLGGGGFGGGGFGGLGGGSGGPLLWLITLAFLRNKGGILGGDDDHGGGGHEMGVLAGQTQSKLDCLAQNQSVIQNQINQQTQQGQFSEINSNIASLVGVNRDIGIAISQEANASRQALSECCCNIRRDVAGVETAIALQTNDINSVANDNTQKILDRLCQNQVTALGVDNANLRSALTKAEILAELKPHGHPRGLAVG